MAELLKINAHGCSYWIEDPGGLIGRSLREGVPYEARVLQHIYRQKLGGLAVDVGAGVGNHTLWFAAVCGLRVIAVEPLDHERLTRNVALNELGELVTVWPLALGDKAGRGKVTGAPAHVIGASFPADGLVPVGLLDDYNLSGVSLLKIDVEGMEPQVLRGARETIARERPLIFAEATDDEAHLRNAAELESLGYTHTKTFGATPLEEWRHGAAA